MTDDEFHEWVEDLKRRNAATMRQFNRDYWMVAAVLVAAAATIWAMS